MEILSERGDSVLFARYTGGDSVLVNKKEWGGFCPRGILSYTLLEVCEINIIFIFVSQKLCCRLLYILCVIIYLLIDQNLKCYNQCIFLCIRVDIAKSVQIWKHLIKFYHVSSTGSTTPLLTKQSAMYMY